MTEEWPSTAESTQGVAPDRIIANGKIGADAKANVVGTIKLARSASIPQSLTTKAKGDTNAAENTTLSC